MVHLLVTSSFLLLICYCNCECEFVPKKAQQSLPSYSTSYYTQPLDHFDSSNKRTFKQKVLTANKYWKKDVMLFYSGNEAAIEMFYENTGFMFELAQQFEALVVFAEHRYYGTTLPFGQLSFTPRNIAYLTMEQAMADFSSLVQRMKSKMGIKKVIAFGGSYGGILTALLRYQYPSVFDGALAGSAPVYMTAGLTDSTAFYEKLTQVYADASSDCPDIVRGAYADINSNAKEGNFQFITQSMKLCKTLTQDKVEHLQGWARDAFTTMAITNYPYTTNFLCGLPAFPVSAACEAMTGDENRMTALANAAGLRYNGTGKLSCFDIDAESTLCSLTAGCGVGNAATAWDYQVCSEVELNITTTNVTDMFPVNTFDVKQHCQEKWGIDKKQTNIDWPGFIQWIERKDPNANIIFSNGDIDPWIVGGVNEGEGGTVSLLVHGGAHHLDMRSSNPLDPSSVIAVRNTEKKIIQEWINK